MLKIIMGNSPFVVFGQLTLKGMQLLSLDLQALKFVIYQTFWKGSRNNKMPTLCSQRAYCSMIFFFFRKKPYGSIFLECKNEECTEGWYSTLATLPGSKIFLDGGSSHNHFLKCCCLNLLCAIHIYVPKYL